MRIDTIGDLLAVVAALPADERARAVARLERAVALTGPARQLALGLVALDLAPRAAGLDQAAAFAAGLRPASAVA